jgi:transposase
LHLVCDGRGRPLRLHLTEGQRSDHKGAEALIYSLPDARTMIADRAYSSAWFRQALAERAIDACIPPHPTHKLRHDYDRTLYKQRHRIENLFARLKDWRRIHTRYDRCADIFLAAITFACICIFWINES